MDNRITVLMLSMIFNYGANAIVIKCLYELDKFYYCHGRVVSGSDTPEITEVLGTHIGNLTLTDVDSLRLVGQGLSTFPPNIHKVFPRTSKIDFGQNQITRVTNADIYELRKLTELILSGNRITELEGNLLRGMCYFKYLDVDNNQIEHVGYNFHFPERGMLFIKNNYCIGTSAVGIIEVLKLKSLFRNKCPPVGEPKQEPLEDWTVQISPDIANEIYYEKVYNEAFYDKMVLMHSRLATLEKKLANAVEIRIHESKVDGREIEDQIRYLY